MTEAKTQPGALQPVHPTVVQVDFAREDHRGALLALLDEYACTPEGGGRPLATEVKASLCDVLAARPHYAGWLAFTDGQPVGLINCFEGVSTFRARPLLNVHDIVVTASYRRRGIASALLRQATAPHLQRMPPQGFRPISSTRPWAGRCSSRRCCADSSSTHKEFRHAVIRHRLRSQPGGSAQRA